jgi:sugar phosphate isomerase/epimerase
MRIKCIEIKLRHVMTHQNRKIYGALARGKKGKENIPCAFSSSARYIFFMLQPGIVADEISRDFRQAVNLGVQVGIRRYEIRFLKTGRAPMCEASELREVERICDGEGVTISALSPGLFKWTDSPAKFSQEMATVFPRAVELAQRWQLSALIIFGFCKPGATEAVADTLPRENPPPWVMNCLEQAATQATRAGLKLYIEPEPVCWADTGVTTVAMLQAIKAPMLAVNYDPCNDAWTLRRDPLPDFDLVAPYIANVHVKDQLDAPLGSGMPTWVVPGQGLLDWRAHFAALKRIGYAGPISLEPHIDGSLETIRSCYEAVEKLWADAHN